MNDVWDCRFRWEDGAPERGQVGGMLGVASAVLLAASIRWAHHWDPLADAIVTFWALSAAGALVVSKWALRSSDLSRRAAWLGLWLGIVSVTALVFAGLAAAAGADPVGACGGG